MISNVDDSAFLLRLTSWHKPFVIGSEGGPNQKDLQRDCRQANKSSCCVPVLSVCVEYPELMIIPMVPALGGPSKNPIDFADLTCPWDAMHPPAKRGRLLFPSPIFSELCGEH